MMRSTRRREGEVVALAFNQKEQRLLDRSAATIKLEASYSLKLLDLGSRSMKVYFRQLRDRVARLQSHLSVAEIQQLRQLEKEGKLRPSHPSVSSGSAMKIAATNRRLHPPRHRRPSTQTQAAPVLGHKQSAGTSSSSPVPRLTRSNSVTGAFLDVPAIPDSAAVRERPQSASVVLQSAGSTLLVSGTPGTKDAQGKGVVAVLNNKACGTDENVITEVAKFNNIPPNSKTKNDFETTDNNPNTAGRNDTVMGKAVDAKPKPNSEDGKVAQKGGTPRIILQSESGSVKPSDSISHQLQEKSGDSAAANDSHPDTGEEPQVPLTSAGRQHIGDTETPRGQQLRSAGVQSSLSTRGANRRSSLARAPFSSHAATEKSQGRSGPAAAGESRGAAGGGGGDAVLGTPRSRQSFSSLDKDSTFLGLLQDDSVDDLDQQLWQERREELIEGEQLRSASLTRRKDRFLKDLDSYLRSHPITVTPPRHHAHPRRNPSARRRKDAPATEGEGSGDGEADVSLSRHRRVVDFDLSPTHLPEADYRERLRGLWRDMNQCRYLRLSDDVLDLSGVNTLATDTLKLYKVLRRQDSRTAHSAPRPVTRDT